MAQLVAMRETDTASLTRQTTRLDAHRSPGPSARLTALGSGAQSIGMARFLNQQNIERYLKQLRIASDETQRRQLKNLLEEEEDKAAELGA